MTQFTGTSSKSKPSEVLIIFDNIKDKTSNNSNV